MRPSILLSEADWVPDTTSGPKPLIPTVEVVPAKSPQFLEAESEEAALILEAVKTYPAGWPRTRRTGYPHLRDLRRHAGIPNITRRARDRAGQQVEAMAPPDPSVTVTRVTSRELRLNRDLKILAVMRTYDGLLRELTSRVQGRSGRVGHSCPLTLVPLVGVSGYAGRAETVVADSIAEEGKERD